MKMLVSMQKRIVFHLQSDITRGKVPDWMLTGGTALLLKGKCKGNEVRNYSPVTGLPHMWKLLKNNVVNEIYNHLEANTLLTKE